MERVARFGGPFEPAVAPVARAQLVRGARGQQSRQRARFAAFERLPRVGFGARETAFEISLRGAEQRVPRLRGPAPLAVSAHVHGQLEGVVHQPREQIHDPERGRKQDEKEDQRQLDAPGRIDEQRVALVAAPDDRQRHRASEHRQQPEERPHAPRGRVTRRRVRGGL